jgi:hypothetical protein
MNGRTGILVVALLVGACGGVYVGIGFDSVDHIRIYKSRGALQCQSAGTPPETMRAQLEASGIDVFDYACGTDGRMYVAMCGRPDDKINILTIAVDRLDQAFSLEFQALGSLPDARETACP